MEGSTADEGAATDGADLLVSCLVRSGVTTIFGLPGDTGVALYDALFKRSDEIRHVLVRDERHAAFMADAYARSTNTVGVMEVSSGGGTTYAVGGLGEAFASSVPLLVLTSDIQTTSRGTGALTEIDQEALFAAVSKWRRVVASADDIPGAVDEALRAATSERPGPAVLVVPEDVLEQRSDAVIRADSDLVRVPRRRGQADPDAVFAAVAVLAAAKRPAIVAGSGVHSSAAWSELAALAESWAIPIATSIHGKGAIATTSPWSLGVAGGNGGTDLANAYLRDADVVLFVGTRANATDTDGYTAPPRQGTTTIAIDIDAVRAGHNYPGGIRLIGDARLILDQLRSAGAPISPDGRAARLRNVRETAAAQNPRTSAAVTTDRLRAGDVIATLADIVSGEKHIVVADPGTATPHVAHSWPVPQAGRRVLCPRGHGPMGYALPASIGAAIARPDDIIIALIADGGFAMCCGELETVRRLELPIIFVQLTNDSMGWIKMLQHLYEGQRYFSVDPGPFDSVMVAHAAGLAAARVHTLDELRHEVTSAIAEQRSIYIDVPVQHMIDDVPPVSSWQAALSGDAARPAY